MINLETIKQEVRESIVKGIIAGYKDYVNERNEVKKRMVIVMPMPLLNLIILKVKLLSIWKILLSILKKMLDHHGSI